MGLALVVHHGQAGVGLGDDRHPGHFPDGGDHGLQLVRPNVMTPFMQEALKDANIGDIGNKVLPELRRRGFTEEQIDRFLIWNPEVLFG